MAYTRKTERGAIGLSSFVVRATPFALLFLNFPRGDAYAWAFCGQSGAKWGGMV
jgi:hypothetical protein